MANSPVLTPGTTTTIPIGYQPDLANYGGRYDPGNQGWDGKNPGSQDNDDFGIYTWIVDGDVNDPNPNYSGAVLGSLQSGDTNQSDINAEEAGWNVTQPDNGHLTVTVPSSMTAATKVCAYIQDTTGDGSGRYFYAVFDVAAASNNNVVAGGPALSFALHAPGDAPSAGTNPGTIVFDIVNPPGAVVLSGSLAPDGQPHTLTDTSGHAWIVQFSGGDSESPVSLTAPAQAVVGSNYEIRANAEADGDNFSAYFNVVAASSAPPSPTAPSAPPNAPAYTGITASGATLDNVPGLSPSTGTYTAATSLNVQIALDSAFTDAVTTYYNVTPSTNFPFSSLATGTTYYVRYVEVNSTGSTPGAYSSFTTLSPPPAAVTALTLTISETTSGVLTMTATWTLPTGGGTTNGYNFRLGTAAGAESTAPLNGSAEIMAGVTLYTFTVDNSGNPLAHAQHYFAVVDAVGPGGTTTSAEATILTDTLPPTNIMTHAGNGYVDLNCTLPAGATGIAWYRAVPGGTFAFLANAPQSGGTISGAYRDTMVKAGATYIYGARGLN